MLNGDTSITIGTIILIASFVITCINFFSSRKKDVSKDVENMIKVNVKLDEICRTTGETRNDIKSIDKQVRDISENQVRHDSEIKSIWKRIEIIEKHLDILDKEE